MRGSCGVCPREPAVVTKTAPLRTRATDVPVQTIRPEGRKGSNTTARSAAGRLAPPWPAVDRLAAVEEAGKESSTEPERTEGRESSQRIDQLSLAGRRKA
jgi:hypothetical protein